MKNSNEVVLNVADVLEDLGVRNVRAQGVETNYSCPGPAHSYGDHRPSAYMRSSYPYPYICFGCGAQGTIVDFVASFKGISRSEAWRWLGENYGFGESYDPEASITETLNRIIGPKSPPVHKVATNEPIYVNPKILPLLIEVPAGQKYLVDRGLHWHTQDAFQLRWDVITGRVAIPYFRTGDGVIIGFKARDITGTHPAKYLVLGDRDKSEPIYHFKPFNTSLELFGHSKFSRDPNDTIIVVEGELNAMRVWQAGFENVVGLPTASLSAFQAGIIRQKYETVILYNDCDEAGLRAIANAENLIGSACRLLVVPMHNKDAMDSEDDEIAWLINNATNTLSMRMKTLGGM